MSNSRLVWSLHGRKFLMVHGQQRGSQSHWNPWQGSRRLLGRRIWSDGIKSAAVAEALRGTTRKVSVFTMKNGFWKWISHGTKLIAREGYRITPAKALVYRSIKEQNIWNVLLCCFSKLQMHLQDKIQGNYCLVSLKCPSFWPFQVPHGLSVAMLGNSSGMANYLKYRNRTKPSKSSASANSAQSFPMWPNFCCDYCLWMPEERCRKAEISSIFT